MNRDYIESEVDSTNDELSRKEQKLPGKHTWRLQRPRVAGSEYKVHETSCGGRIDCEGLNAMLSELGYKTSSWDPR